MNFTDWSDLDTILETNESMIFPDPSRAESDRQFYRAITLP